MITLNLKSFAQNGDTLPLSSFMSFSKMFPLTGIGRCDFNGVSKAGWGHCLCQTFEEGQTVANFVDTGSLSSVHSRLAYIGSSCLLKMLLVSTSIVFEDSPFFPA